MTLLITGGAGFIGGEIVQAAVARGERVRVLDSFRPDVHTEQATARSAPPVDGVEYQTGDVRDAATLERALDGVDVVCHQAAKVGLGVDLQDAPDYTSSNVQGTAELVAAMERCGIRSLVIASSMVVYGEGAYRTADGSSRRPAARTIADLDVGRFEPRDPSTGLALEPELIDEDDALDPRNVYALSKLAQEHLASAWARSTGGCAAMLRYHNVYGPRMPRNTPYAGVAALFRSSLEHGEAPRVFEDGGQRRDFVHVADVAAANLAAIDAVRDGRDGGDGAASAIEPGTARAYNVGSGRITTIGEIAAGLAHVMGGAKPVVTGQYRLGDVRHITASSARAAAELNWHAQVTLDAGLRDFANAVA